MAKIDRILAEVERLVDTVKPQEAEDKLTSLIETMGDEELRTWEADLRVTINRFLKKRRRQLTLVLDQRLRPRPATPLRLRRDKEPPQPAFDALELRQEFAEELSYLSDRHIFQWSTFYRDTLSDFFDRFMDAMMDGADWGQVLEDVLRQPLRDHAQEIFEKGTRYHIGQRGEQAHIATTKSIGGLQRFLDLPIEFFSTRDTTADPAEARALRRVTSTMLGAILEGYGRLDVDPVRGRELLPSYPQAWAHSLGFLTELDFEWVVSNMVGGDFHDGLERVVHPFLQALDELTARDGDYIPLPALAQFNAHARRLDVSLMPPPYAAEPQLIEIQCFLDTAFVTTRDLDEALSRRVGVVVAPLRPDLRAHVNQSERLRRIVAPASDDASSYDATRQRVISNLEFAIYRRRSPRLGAQPLQYNFAREFPLNNPFLTRYYHVYRSSVRELLRAFERRNGVRLWCSVRRSGKTTACLDLGETTGSSVIVTQTCETTGQIPEGSVLYDRVCEALSDGRQIDASFLERVVRNAASEIGDGRIVLIIDEYETLFGRLSSAVGRDPDLRYTVAQPLLNQMVAFTRDNLLVFLGQQPNAHFILMDQNQLSPYVEQDAFPLFQWDEGWTTGEFAELIRRVLTERIVVEPDFIAGIYQETAGHPFLTVNLLVEVVEWLIEQKRPVASLRLDGDDVERFSKQAFRPRRISLSPEYRFFREAVAEALGPHGRSSTPWLHAVYACVRGVARVSPETMVCSLADFDQIVETAALYELGFDTDSLLATARQANFLDTDGERVWPKIKLLARLAAVTRGRVSA